MVSSESQSTRSAAVSQAKAYDVADGITKANSGVPHAGFMVPAGSLKARFNVEEIELYKALARDFGIEVRECGKLVIIAFAASRNVVLNLALIPHFGLLGAAVAVESIKRPVEFQKGCDE